MLRGILLKLTGHFLDLYSHAFIFLRYELEIFLGQVSIAIDFKVDHADLVRGRLVISETNSIIGFLTACINIDIAQLTILIEILEGLEQVLGLYV